MVFYGLFDIYSMKQPDLYYVETENDVRSLVRSRMENTSRRRVFYVNFDQAYDVLFRLQNSIQ